VGESATVRCGIDIGGTKVLGIAVESNPLDPAAETKSRTIYDDDELIESIVGVITRLERETGRSMVSIGIGIAGIVDRRGTLRYSPNIPGVVDLPIHEIISERLGRPIRIENDATTAAWAEHLIGAGAGSENMLFVGLGTGIGTGFVLDGNLHRGWNGFSGESGHMTIDKLGPLHLTGARGPWELTASGSGLARLAAKYAEDGKLDSVLDLAGSVSGIDAEHIQQAVEAGAADVLKLLDTFAIDVGIGLANLVHLLDPEVIVIGGGLVDLGEPLLGAIRRRTESMVLGGGHRPPVHIRAAKLGSRAGAIGAALLAPDPRPG